MPQVIISFEKQAGDELSFTVVIVRLVTHRSKSLKELFRELLPDIKLAFEEIKIIGSLKKKYSKEANVFRVFLQKAPYFAKTIQ